MTQGINNRRKKDDEERRVDTDERKNELVKNVPNVDSKKR
jgi:hypothetical protein